MKIILTETQYKNLIYLIESNNPCPKDKKEDILVTLDDLKNGKFIEKGYCNTSSNSALVYVQKQLKDKKLLVTTISPGYFGDLTEKALEKLYGKEVDGKNKFEGDYINNDVITVLDKYTKEEKETEEIITKDEDVKPHEAEALFKKLTTNEKILVCTLLGEAQSEGRKGMQAVANVLKNRKDEKFGGNSTLVGQAKIKGQFSMWNNKTNEQLFSNKDYKNSVKMAIAIDLVKNIETLEDVTGGAIYYYANYLHPIPQRDGKKKKGCNCHACNDSKVYDWEQTVIIGGHTFGNYVKKPIAKKN